MKVSKLIKLLEAIKDKDLEVFYSAPRDIPYEVDKIIVNSFGVYLIEQANLKNKKE